MGFPVVVFVVVLFNKLLLPFFEFFEAAANDDGTDVDVDDEEEARCRE